VKNGIPRRKRSLWGNAKNIWGDRPERGWYSADAGAQKRGVTEGPPAGRLAFKVGGVAKKGGCGGNVTCCWHMRGQAMAKSLFGPKGGNNRK